MSSFQAVLKGFPLNGKVSVKSGAGFAYSFRCINPGNIMDLRAFLFGSTTRQITYKSLDAGAMRQRAISQNLANVTTPGYKRKEVSFEDELSKMMKIKLNGTRTDQNHMEISQEAALRKINPKVYMPEDPTLPGEINNVDIDIENAKLAENQILFQYALKFADFTKYQAAITGQPK